MHYQSFRRGSISTRGREVERAVASIDPYLYVDVAWGKPGQEQLWRKHPEAHLPMLLFEIPSHASLEGIKRKLQEMDHAGVDLYKQMYERTMYAKRRAEEKRMANHFGRMREVATYINKHL